MFKFYSGLLNLNQEHVQHIANVIRNDLSPDYAKNNTKWFERFVDQTLFFWENPLKMKNPITVLLANGWLHGIHPGTSRFLGSVLANADTIPALAVCHIDPSSTQALEKYLIDYKETDDYAFYTERPCKNSFQPKTRDNVATHDTWIEEESIDDVAHRVVWSKKPNIQWVDYDNNILFSKITNEDLDIHEIKINDFNEFWQSLIDIATS